MISQPPVMVRLIVIAIKTGVPQPSEFLVFNTRRPVFSDIRVRQALTLLFDFEWINRNYFFGSTGARQAFSPAPNCRRMAAPPMIANESF